VNNQPALSLKLAAIVAAVEMVALAGAGIWLIVPGLRAGGDGLTMGLSSGGFVLAGGVLLGVLALALYRGRRWSRGPLVVIQLLLLPLGYQFLGGSAAAIGAGLMAAAAAVLVLLFLPASTRYFVSQESQESQKN
jgi:hypothetical protein